MWKPLKQIPDYMVCCTGKVMSLKDEKPRILKQSVDGKGYLFVNLSNNGKIKAYRVHRLVANAFLNLSLNNQKICVLHKDDNPKNNNVVNLSIGTQKDNIQDMIKKGRRKISFKLSIEQVTEIRERLKNGEKGKKLSKEYKISEASISFIKSNKRWKI